MSRYTFMVFSSKGAECCPRGTASGYRAVCERWKRRFSRRVCARWLRRTRMHRISAPEKRPVFKAPLQARKP